MPKQNHPLPRWLIAESLDGEREYIIHTTSPRFILEMTDAADGSVEGTPAAQWDEITPKEAATLMREAGEAWRRYCDNLNSDNSRATAREQIEAAIDSGMSVYRLAKRSGVPYSTVYDYVHNNVDISGTRLELLIKALT
jgi:hypothetical protein